MFPDSFAHDVINRYSQERDTVLDVFAGRGTSLYSAAALNRRGLGVEVNPVGWIYTRTKLSPVDKTRVEKRLEEIQSIAPRYSSSSAKLPLFFHHCFSC